MCPRRGTDCCRFPKPRSRSPPRCRAPLIPAADPFTDGNNIDIYTRPQDGRTFVYVTAGSGWRVIDVTDPTHPAVVHSVSLSSERTFRGVAVDQEGAVLGMTDDNRFADGGQFGYVRFYNLAADPANPPLIGQEILAEAYTGIPGRLDLSGNYAYVATAGAGVQVVDIDPVEKSCLRRHLF